MPLCSSTSSIIIRSSDHPSHQMCPHCNNVWSPQLLGQMERVCKNAMCVMSQFVTAWRPVNVGCWLYINSPPVAFTSGHHHNGHLLCMPECICECTQAWFISCQGLMLWVNGGLIWPTVSAYVCMLYVLQWRYCGWLYVVDLCVQHCSKSICQ